MGKGFTVVGVPALPDLPDYNGLNRRFDTREPDFVFNGDNSIEILFRDDRTGIDGRVERQVVVRRQSRAGYMYISGTLKGDTHRGYYIKNNAITMLESDDGIYLNV
tara:strand:+ start:3727 stop:4044 length:318 start_codon:yes stop_codon:yes gene_type:complete